MTSKIVARALLRAASCRPTCQSSTRLASPTGACLTFRRQRIPVGRSAAFSTTPRHLIPQSSIPPHQASSHGPGSTARPQPQMPTQEDVLRNALSRLTPAQIRFLLSNPNPQAWQQHEGNSPDGNRQKRWFSPRTRSRLAYAAWCLAALYLGFVFVDGIILPDLTAAFPVLWPFYVGDPLERGSAEWLDSRWELVRFMLEVPLLEDMILSNEWRLVFTPGPFDGSRPVVGYPGLSPALADHLRRHAGRAGPSETLLDFGQAGTSSRGGGGGGGGGGSGKHYMAQTTAYETPFWVKCENRLRQERCALLVWGATAAGWPGVVHGGHQAAVLLEFFGDMTRRLGDARLSVRYRAPVLVGAPYLVRWENWGEWSAAVREALEAQISTAADGSNGGKLESPGNAQELIEALRTGRVSPEELERAWSDVEKRLAVPLRATIRSALDTDEVATEAEFWLLDPPVEGEGGSGR